MRTPNLNKPFGSNRFKRPKSKDEPCKPTSSKKPRKSKKNKSSASSENAIVLSGHPSLADVRSSNLSDEDKSSIVNAVELAKDMDSIAWTRADGAYSIGTSHCVVFAKTTSEGFTFTVSSRFHQSACRLQVL